MGRAFGQDVRRMLRRVGNTAILGILMVMPLTAQLAPGPIWRQEPPIGGFATDFVYVDAAGALCAIGGNALGKRVWRLSSAWQEVVTEPAPRNFISAAFAYDMQRDVVVMFGGLQNQHSDETWEFDGVDWTQMQPATWPTARLGAAMSYHPIRQCCVLYGGGEFTTAFDDTWEYDGTTWIPITTATTPQLRDGSAMTFDQNLQQILLVGPSLAAPSNSCETYRYDGVNWHAVLTSNAPAARNYARIAFDLVSNRTVLAGGYDPFVFVNPTDVWTYNGFDWQPAGPTLPNNLGRGFTFWPLVGELAAVGGTRPNQAPSGAVYSFGLGGWTQVTPEVPFDLFQPLLAFDSARECLVLHGGRYNGTWQNETWEWRRTTGWSATWFGSGPTDGMAYDPIRQRIVAVQGNDTLDYANGVWTAQQLSPTPGPGIIWYDRHVQRIRVSSGNQLWTYDGQAWTAQPIANNTPTGFEIRAAHWSATGEVIASQLGNSLAWRFDGVTWSSLPSDTFLRVTEVPLRGAMLSTTDETVVMTDQGINTFAARSHEEARGLPLVTDVVRGDVYAVDRQGEVWRLDWLQSPAVGRYGAGCSGSNGIPDLRTLGTTNPTLGTPVPLQLASLPSAPGAALLMLGESIETWDAVPLPSALDVLGLPGCRAWIPARTFTAVAHSGGAVTFQLALPTTPVLAGKAIGVQALVLDPAASVAWGSVSNALMITAY